MDGLIKEVSYRNSEYTGNLIVETSYKESGAIQEQPTVNRLDFTLGQEFGKSYRMFEFSYDIEESGTNFYTIL